MLMLPVVAVISFAGKSSDCSLLAERAEVRLKFAYGGKCTYCVDTHTQAVQSSESVPEQCVVKWQI